MTLGERYRSAAESLLSFGLRCDGLGLHVIGHVPPRVLIFTPLSICLKGLTTNPGQQRAANGSTLITPETNCTLTW